VPHEKWRVIKMEGIGRQTIIFFLPNSMEAFTNDQSPNTLSEEGVGWFKTQLYINPQSFDINDKKFIKSDFTKGGFVTQYWGEDLTKISIGGTTGSAGIEGINVLRSIYRHEQGQYRKLLDDRRRQLAEEAASIQAQAISDSESRNFGTNALDLLTGGAYTQTVDGIKNAVEIIGDAITGESQIERTTFRSIPTLAALATNVDMYYQGEFFRGYFEMFNVRETASEPGHFTYTTSFMVTRRTGERNNFMPWHRNPLNSSGVAQMSKSVTEAKGDPLTGGDNFTFPIGGYEESSIQSEVTIAQDMDQDLDRETSLLQNRPGQG